MSQLSVYEISSGINTTFHTDAGDAVEALDSITIAGGTNINTAGAGSTVTINLDDTITLTTVNATTFDTNILAAGLTLSGTTLSADGTDLNIDVNITAKGTGQVVIDDLNISGLTAGTLRSDATGNITSLADGANGTLLIGKNGDVPIWATLSDGNNITCTEGANSISIAVTGTTQYAVQVGDATGSLDSLAVGSADQILQSGGAGANPAWSTATYPSTVNIGDILVASAADTITTIVPATATHVLTANGVGAAPTFQAQTFGTVTSVSGGTNISTSGTAADPVVDLDATITLTTVNATTFDTNVTAAAVTLSGTTLSADGTDPNIDLILTPKGTGTIQITGFGAGVVGSDATGKLSSTGTTQYALQVGDATSTLDSLGIGTAGQILQSGGAGANPAWSTVTYPSTVNIGDILVASAADTITTIVPATAGHVLTANGVGAAPTFQANPADGVQSVSGGTNISMSGTATDPVVDLDAALTAMTSITVSTGGSLQTGTTSTNTLLIQAYDTNLTGYVPFITLTAADTPTMDINSDATLGTKYIYRADGTDVVVADGGTGASTLTDHCVLVGSGTGAITPITIGTSGQVLVGSLNADPVFASISAGTGMTVTEGAGTLGLSTTGTTLNNQTGTTYEFVAGDIGKAVTFTNANPITVTVPVNADVAIAIGSILLCYQGGAGQVTFTPEGGVTIRSADSLLSLYGQYSVCALLKIDTDTWSLSGDLA